MFIMLFSKYLQHLEMRVFQEILCFYKGKETFFLITVSMHNIYNKITHSFAQFHIRVLPLKYSNEKSVIIT